MSKLRLSRGFKLGVLGIISLNAGKSKKLYGHFLKMICNFATLYFHGNISDTMILKLKKKSFINFFKYDRFYFVFLMILTIHLVSRRLLIKLNKINPDFEISFIEYTTAALYAIFYVCCFFSAIILRKRISKKMIYCWGIIVMISVTNELYYFSNRMNPNDILYSIFNGQAHTSIRLSLAILFLNVCSALNESKKLSFRFINIVKQLTIINCVLIFIGIVFNIDIFDSYPSSQRWGYSGVLNRGYSVIFSSVYLIDLLGKNKKPIPFIVLLSLSLLASGTKAGIFSLLLIILFVWIKSKMKRLLLVFLGTIVGLTSAWKINWLLTFSSFWKDVYAGHGLIGTIFSLRNENINDLMLIVKEEYSIYNWIFGGKVRSEFLWIEILPLDVFAFYGVVGLVVIVYYFVNIIPSWRLSIPLIVGCLNGIMIFSTFSFVFYGCWLITNEKLKAKFNN